MSALNGAELASARADAASMLPDTCTVQRRTRAPDGGGSQTVTYPQLATGVPCKLSAASEGPALEVTAERVADGATHHVALPHGQDVQDGDRLVISGTTYMVLLVRTAGAWELNRHALVKPA